MNKPINFYEIDKNGDHIVRIAGGDEQSKEQRGNLMRYSEAMLNALQDARNQIEYLQEKFQETGSGNAVLSRIDSLLEIIDH